MGYTILSADFQIGRTVVLDIRSGRGHWPLKSYDVREFAQRRKPNELEEIVAKAEIALNELDCDVEVRELCEHMLKILKDELATRNEIFRQAQE